MSKGSPLLQFIRGFNKPELQAIPRRCEWCGVRETDVPASELSSRIRESIKRNVDAGNITYTDAMQDIRLKVLRFGPTPSPIRFAKRYGRPHFHDRFLQALPEDLAGPPTKRQLQKYHQAIERDLQRKRALTFLVVVGDDLDIEGTANRRKSTPISEYMDVPSTIDEIENELDRVEVISNTFPAN